MARDYFNVQCGLQSFFRNDLLPERKAAITAALGNFADKMSALAIEASRSIHFDIYRRCEDNQPLFDGDISDRNYFIPYFKALTVNDFGNTGSAQYFRLRRECAPDLPTTDNDRNGNAINSLAHLFYTNFANNVWMHTKKRVKKFIKIIHRDDATQEQIKDTIDVLFNGNSIVWQCKQ